MKTPKKFDCVQMKWEIQQQLAEEFATMSDKEAYAIQMERVRHNPILGQFLQRVAFLKKKAAS